MKTSRAALVKTVGFELARGFRDNKLVLTLFVLVLLATQLAFFVQVRQPALAALYPNASVSFFDALVYFFRGMNEYRPELKLPFLLDVYWIAPYLLFGYLACFYPQKDLKGYSAQIVSRSCSRWVWFASKYLFVAIVVLLYYLSILVIVLLITLLWGDVGVLTTTLLGSAALQLDLSLLKTPELIAAIGIAVIAALALVAFSMTVSLAGGALWSYAALVLLLVASAYYATPYLWMNYTMLARSALLLSEGCPLEIGLPLCFGVLVVALTCGSLFSRKVEYR